MGCGTKCVQYLFFAFNFLFFILGIAVLAVGIYSRVENDTWKDLITTDTFMQAANLLIAAGVIVAILGFLGCCGACKKWNWMLIGYSIFVILIFILEIAAGLYAYTQRETIETSLTAQLQDGININFGESDTASKGLTKAINYFQQTVKCCGLDGPKDWANSTWYKNLKIAQDRVPESCCKTEEKDCSIGKKYTDTKDLYTKGCKEEGKKFAKDNLWLLGGVGVGIAVVQLLGIIFALLLCKSYKDEKEGNVA